MKINGQWGTVCDDNWSTGSSIVVCRQLGLGNTGTLKYYGAGPINFPILFDEVICDGNEINILACSHLGLYEQNCNHGEDVGVTCFGLYSKCGWLPLQMICILFVGCTDHTCMKKHKYSLYICMFHAMCT